VLDLGPGVPGDVPPAQAQLEWPAAPDVHGELAQPAPHPAGESDLDLSECSAEVPNVELSMQCFQPVKESEIAGTRALLASPPLVRRIGVNRELEKRAFGLATEWTRNPRIEESYDRLQHVIRRKSIAPVDPEHPAIQGQHDGPVGVGQNSFHLTETKSPEPGRKIVFKQITLTRRPAGPLPRRCQSP